MRILPFLTAAMLLAAPALALEPAPPPTLPAILSTSTPHTCQKFYPIDASRDGTEGSTQAGFTIKADGSVKDIHLLKSAGNASLDQAALDCMQDWHYRPAMLNGNPVEAPWKVTVEWKLMADPFMDTAIAALPPGALRPAAVGAPHYCNHSQYPRAAWMNGIGGRVMIAYHIATDGTVKDLAVAQSSGNDLLDNAALRCAAAWSYVPAQLNGQPIEVSWRAYVDWRVRRGDPPPASATLPPISKDGEHVCSAHRKNEGTAADPGTAIFSFTVAADGTMKDLTLRHSSGDAVYDSYATDCVSQWRFTPATRDGIAVDWPTGARVAWTP